MNALWLLCLTVVGELGIGVHSLPFFTLTFCPVLLIYTRQQWIHCPIAFIANTVSVSVATLTTYNIEYGTPPFTHLSRVIGQSAQSNLIVLVCVVLDRLSFGTNNVWTRVLVFPCAWTSLWYINGYWGGHSGYSNGISDWAEWAQMVDLGGRAFLEFIMVLFATCLLEYQSWMALFLVKSSRRTPSNVNRSTNAMRLLKHPLSVYFGLVVFVYVYGGIQSSFRRGAFFQRPTKDWLPATETVACVVGPGGFDEDLRSDYSYWMQKSEDAAQRGAKLVLWSEEIILASTWEDEQRLRQMAITVAKKHSIYLVIAYDRLYPVNHNMAVMVSPQGHILIDYIKANPVPKDENNEPGPGALLFIDTPEFGRIGLAICYDLSVPRFILQASQHNVDILLQPAYSWGANGPNNLHDQQLRAIENGLTLFRCISQGISGIIEPVIHGHFEQKTAVIANQVVFFNLPLQKRIKTVYSAYLGDSIPLACILYSLNFVASLLYHHMKRIVK